MSPRGWQSALDGPSVIRRGGACHNRVTPCRRGQLDDAELPAPLDQQSDRSLSGLQPLEQLQLAGEILTVELTETIAGLETGPGRR